MAPTPTNSTPIRPAMNNSGETPVSGRSFPDPEGPVGKVGTAVSDGVVGSVVSGATTL
jgi:hypothetical protein